MDMANTGIVRGVWRVLALLLLLVAADGLAAEPVQKHQRGEFHFFTGPAADWVELHSVAPAWDEKRLASEGMRWRTWLLDSQYARFGGKRRRYFDHVYEATSPSLLTEAGKVEIDYNPEFETLTIHEISLRRAGEWLPRLKPDAITLGRRETEFERDMAMGSVSALIVLDDLRLGDLVRVRYTVAGHNPIMAGLDHVGGTFALTTPLLARQLRVLFDADAQPQEYRDARVAPAQVERTARYLAWRYRADAVAAVVPEDRNPAWFFPYPYVMVSEQRSWADVAAWARGLYPPAQPLPQDLQQRIAQWRALPDVPARIAAALLAVQEEVRYFGVEIGDNTHKPAEPADVWNRRRGDCKDKSRLLVTLLAAMEIEAYPALVSAGSGKRVADTPAAASAFDHVIVQVRNGRQLLWLDPTQVGQRGPAAAQEIGDFGFALPIAADTRALVPLARNPDNASRSRVLERYVAEAGGEALAMSVRSEYSGIAANSLRRDLRAAGSEQLGRRYADFYRRRFAGLEVAQALKVDDDEGSNSLVVSESYRIVKPWTQSTSGQRALDLSADSIGGALSLPESLRRQTPLALSFPSEISHRIELELPAGWRWSGATAQRKLDDAAATYRYRSGEEKGSVFSEESFVAREASVGVERMNAHLDWRRQAREQNLQRWVFSLPPAEADKARKARMNDLLRDVMNDNKKATKEKNEN